MAKIKGAIVVDTERCKGCNLCVVACPLDVIALNKEVNMKGYNYAWQVKEDTCNGCSSCATVCPDGCISVYKVKGESKKSIGQKKLYEGKETKLSPMQLSVAVRTVTSVILLLPNRKCWKRLPN